MPAPRKTLIAYGRMAALGQRMELARQGDCGTAVISFEQAAARLAGGFCRPIDQDELRAVIQKVLPTTDLGELEAIKLLPGMVGAAAETLRKAWRAGVDLQERAAAHKRVAAMAALERAVLEALPSGMMRPVDLVQKALRRIAHAPSIFGSIDIVGITELSPCWRPLLLELAIHLPLTWRAGPRHVPKWLAGSRVAIEQGDATTPAVSAVSAANALHEAIEALRWARELVAAGRAKPSEIAIAAASPTEYDDHFLTLRADANLDLRFVHGTSALATREGQAAAALADLLVNGLSQTRIRRLASLARDSGLFSGLPENWTRVLPADAPLNSPAAWERLLSTLTKENWLDGVDHTHNLRGIVEQIGRGMAHAEEVASLILTGRALNIWRKALEEGPPAAIELTLAQLRLDDCLEAPNSIAWMPASALASSPRSFVRLLGLSSRAWPRLAAEDPLLPDHVIRSTELDPLPIGQADRRDFATILATAAKEVVLSRPRRDGEGRLLGRSPLLHTIQAEEIYLQRNRAPAHAMSESDRLFARGEEFEASSLARSATGAWNDWRRPEITAHDGLVRSDHPLVLHILDRDQSATSLRKLLRDPLGFLWRYGLRLKSPSPSEEPLTLDHRDFGDLLHRVLEGVVKRLEADGALAKASELELQEAIEASLKESAEAIESERAVPPAAIWRRSLAEVGELARAAVRPAGEEALPGQMSFAEVPFGRPDQEEVARNLPWDTTRPVEIPGAGLRITGFIDRLDLSGDCKMARVSDYKTGKPPAQNKPFVLDGGKELQRCLYSFAVKALLDGKVEVEAALRYPRADRVFALEEGNIVLTRLTNYLARAKTNLGAGHALPGPDAADKYNDLAFALPANAKKSYCSRKAGSTKELIGDAALVWDAE